MVSARGRLIRRNSSERYGIYLRAAGSKTKDATAAEAEVKNSPEYKQLDDEFKAEDAKINSRRQEIDNEVALIDLQTTAVNGVFQLIRGRTNVNDLRG